MFKLTPIHGETSGWGSLSPQLCEFCEAHRE